MFRPLERQLWAAARPCVRRWLIGALVTILIVGSSFLVLPGPAHGAAVPPPYLLQWGELGSATGQFNTPRGVAVDSYGAIYVADTGNHRIQKFTSTGAYLLQWGAWGNDNGQFNWPFGLAVDSDGNVFVADTDNHRIQKFTSTGDYLRQWGTLGSGNGQFDRPYAIAVDTHGNIYVADTNNHRIQKFTNHGDYLRQWGALGSGDGQLNGPAGLAIDNNNQVYVADPGNSRIQQFTSNGAYLRQWGTWGHAAGQFFLPYAVAVDSNNHVYVADQQNHRIQQFTNNGDYLTHWGTQGSSNGYFESPYGITVDSSSNVYVADQGNHRIQKFGVAVTKLTVVLDAQPLQRLNFRFSGDLGPFKLRDKKYNDAKRLESTIVEPGAYTIVEQVPPGWYLNITCMPADSSVVNVATSSVVINVGNGQEVTCGFTNQQSALVRVLKYNDRNGNHRRNHGEPYLSGWTIDLYGSQAAPAPTGYTKCADEGQYCSFNGVKDVAYGANGVFYYRKGVTGGIDCTNEVFGDPLYGVAKACYIKDSATATLVGRQVTNQHGKASFTNVRPGLLTICEIQQPGWFNSQPGSTEPLYGQPCYTQNVLPGVKAVFTFGNTTTPMVTAADATAMTEGILLTAPDDPATAADEDTYPEPVTDAAFLNTPAPETADYATYLPLVRQ